MNDLAGVIGRLSGARVLVVGDVMMDEYLWGRVTRISPEAPVPVVETTNSTFLLGGAANVAHNVLSLGGRVALAGVVGDDAMGRRLLDGLAEKGLRSEGLVVEEGRPTTVKTRIIAHQQQVVRVDREARAEVSSDSQRKILRFLQEAIRGCPIVVVSDYAKGVVTPGLMKDLLNLAAREGARVLVDPKVPHLPRYHGCSILTPNHLEAAQASGIPIEDATGLAQAGRSLLARLQCEAVLITRGEQGMSLFEQGGRETHLPTVARQVFDVTGAGDTVVGTLGLALSAGASLQEGARLANFAAGIVVGVVGTATVAPEELRERVREAGSA